jgi:S1-C subfamily serine protease
MRRTAALAAAALLAAGCGSKDKPAQSTSRVEVIQGMGAEGGFDAQGIYKAESPGVVTVMSMFGGGEGGEGSGFVLDGHGEVATNAHVVANAQGSTLRRASQVYVEFADGNRVEAKILGADPNADVALLRVDPSGLSLRPLPLGESAKVQVGQPVAAIGSPFGRRQSLSVGVVSAVDRSVSSLTDFDISGAIQTDAAINPGNSGGPLVDAGGRVIGINQQIETKSGGGEGVGFAVPVDVVKRSLDQLRASGQARYAYLGVSSVAIYPQLVERFGLGVAKGAWIQDVTAGGPAAASGLRGGSGEETFQGSTYRRGGDVITKIGDTPVTSSDDLAGIVARYKPGETVTVEIHRGGDTRRLRVKLGDRPPASAGSGG